MQRSTSQVTLDLIITAFIIIILHHESLFLEIPYLCAAYIVNQHTVTEAFRHANDTYKSPNGELYFNFLTFDIFYDDSRPRVIKFLCNFIASEF